MLYTQDHRSIMDSIRRFVAAEIDPFVDEWEAAETFPAHALFRGSSQKTENKAR